LKLPEKRRKKKEALAEDSFRSSFLFHLIYIYAWSAKKVAASGSREKTGFSDLRG
jgi:hypothetical protein